MRWRTTVEGGTRNSSGNFVTNLQLIWVSSPLVAMTAQSKSDASQMTPGQGDVQHLEQVTLDLSDVHILFLSEAILSSFRLGRSRFPT